jgi:hypothetical protein
MLLITFPLKTTSRIDILNPLITWVSRAHPGYSASDCKKDLQRLDSLRACLVESIATPHTGYELALKDIKDLYEYHACLVACEERGFPTSGSNAAVNATLEAKLRFEWQNAFRMIEGKDDLTSLSRNVKTSFHYERACVLWNIAALKAHQAAEGDWSTKEGLMEINKSYALIANIFIVIKELLKFENGLTSDLYETSLNMCQHISLAQRYLCAYEILKLEIQKEPTRKKYQMWAEYAVKTAYHYDSALGYSQHQSLKSTLAKTTSPNHYGGHCKSMSMLFKSRAEYIQCLQEKDDNKYGLVIARLRNVKEMLQEGSSFLNNADVHVLSGPVRLGGLSSGLNGLLSVVSSMLEKIEKDNASIYKEKITPHFSSAMDIYKPGEMDENESFDLPPEFMPCSLARPMFDSLPSWR